MSDPVPIGLWILTVLDLGLGLCLGGLDLGLGLDNISYATDQGSILLILMTHSGNYSQSEAPWGDPPGRSLTPDLTPCHLTVICLASKKLMGSGMRLGLTSLS